MREVQAMRPGWSPWIDDIPKGESLSQVAARADRAIARVLPVDGDVAVFAHGHFLRILTARWLGLPPDGGRLFAFGTASVSVLGYEHRPPVVTRWNLSPSA